SGAVSGNLRVPLHFADDSASGRPPSRRTPSVESCPIPWSQGRRRNSQSTGTSSSRFDRGTTDPLGLPCSPSCSCYKPVLPESGDEPRKKARGPPFRPRGRGTLPFARPPPHFRFGL